ncbi:uncharacterized protein EV154DRAFT_438668 [Mucor mucedo]|uniref:uncharacterized protein n=1 Tax=Mucor mucedo TaxID=29922 RepID=UPI002220EEF6|nr:uncharacterized protein EV154DRAFT_438668 [Mucor mucedo]KAI7894122.1 hypothetical protein EV154DRAFT_438668 [Mucor mucedo]
MSSTTTISDDIMTLSSYAAIINETLPHNPELQLCINDLVHPTESAETLLETLSNEQLNIIEQAVNKIKERKLNTIKDQGVDTTSTQTTSSSNNTPMLSAVSTCTPNSPMEHGSSVSSSSIKVEEAPWNSTATQVAKALADAISTTGTTTNKSSSLQPNTTTNKCVSSNSKSIPSTTTTTTTTTTTNTTTTTTSTVAKPPTTPSPFLSSHEPTTELKEGIEWVSFVYSHHRTLRRYCIRTDLDQVDTSILDDKFKKENCVYPRANLPRETYRGNRWAYETECNVLGWKLAYLNLEEIAGKRGLIQRAVDSYRNRYPSMRSRRVARQEKLLKGTLRKRKHRDNEDGLPQKTPKTSHDTVEKAPKTILIEDANIKCRIRINIESVVLDAIDVAFRKNNCVFPRAMHITSDTPCVTQRRLDEAKCNEIGWKLAWLNPRQLANKKNLLQRALDTFRNQFTVDLKPRKYASRIPPQPYVPPPPSPIVAIKQEGEDYLPLTVETLAEFDSTTTTTTSTSTKRSRRDSNQSCYSGTTVTLDFNDYCFSPPAEEEEGEVIPFHGTMFDDLILATLPLNIDDVLSEGSSTSQNLSSSYQNTPSPQSLMTFYQQALLLKENDPSLFMMENENNETVSSSANVVDFMTKYQSVVNAGMGDFTADPALLNQLF